MNSREVFILVLTLLVSAFHVYLSYYKKRIIKLDLSGYSSIFLAISAVVASFDLSIRAFLDAQLREALGADVVILVLGCISVSWIGIVEILKSFRQTRVSENSEQDRDYTHLK